MHLARIRMRSWIHSAIIWLHPNYCIHSDLTVQGRSKSLLGLIGTWGNLFALIPKAQEWFPIYFAKETCAKCYNFNKSDKTEQATFLLRGKLNSTRIKICNNIPKRTFNRCISLLWIKTNRPLIHHNQNNIKGTSFEFLRHHTFRCFYQTWVQSLFYSLVTYWCCEDLINMTLAIMMMPT